MTKQEAIDSIYRGSLVECTREEYSAIRKAIQEQAGKWIDRGDHVRGIIALEEVKRLDKKFNS